jgi:hypothetical protein
MTPESAAKKSVTRSLEALKTSGDVYWHTRLQSGMFSIDGHFCHASEKGTFDLVALFRARHGGLSLAFIEVKRNDIKAKLSDTQEAFKIKYDGKHTDIHFWLVQSGAEVTRLIIQHGYDRLADVQM